MLDLAKLFTRLEYFEKFSPRPYRDTVGKLTIGIGWNIDDVPMPRPVAEFMLAHQVADTIADLTRYLPWWRQMNEVRQSVLVDLCFNMGIGSAKTGRGLLSFVNTLDAMRAGEYEIAARGMLNSKWARQVGPRRANPLVQMMRTGVDTAPLRARLARLTRRSTRRRKKKS